MAELKESVTSSASDLPEAAGLPAPASGRVLAYPSSAPTTRRHRRTGLWIVAIAALLTLGGGIGWYAEWRPVAVASVQPVRGTAVEAVYATGTVEAIDTARVGTMVAGRITSLAVDEGDEVQPGQLLAQLDDRQAQQRLEDARARLALAEQELKRNEDLLKGGYRSQEAVQQARKERDQAKAAVELFLRQLEDCRITAPLHAIVMKRPVEPGETVAANAILFELASPEHLRVAADVDERDIPQIRMGAAVAVRSDAFPNRAFETRVTNIRRQGDIATRTYRVEADLPPATPLLIGMTLDVNIVVAERTDALLVPSSAVLHDTPQGGRPGAAYVYRLEADRAQRAAIELGAEGKDSVEVRRGLTEGDRVIDRPPAAISNGRRVAPSSPR